MLALNKLSNSPKWYVTALIYLLEGPNVSNLFDNDLETINSHSGYGQHVLKREANSYILHDIKLRWSGLISLWLDQHVGITSWICHTSINWSIVKNRTWPYLSLFELDAYNDTKRGRKFVSRLIWLYTSCFKDHGICKLFYDHYVAKLPGVMKNTSWHILKDGGVIVDHKWY